LKLLRPVLLSRWISYSNAYKLLLWSSFSFSLGSPLPPLPSTIIIVPLVVVIVVIVAHRASRSKSSVCLYWLLAFYLSRLALVILALVFHLMTSRHLSDCGSTCRNFQLPFITRLILVNVLSLALALAYSLSLSLSLDVGYGFNIACVDLQASPLDGQYRFVLLLLSVCWLVASCVRYGLSSLVLVYSS
jgi:hypothetical protein